MCCGDPIPDNAFPLLNAFARRQKRDAAPTPETRTVNGYRLTE